MHIIKFFGYFKWMLTGCPLYIGAIAGGVAAAAAGAAISAGANALQGSAAKGGIRGPSKEALFKGIEAQQIALVGAQNWAKKSQEEQQAIIEDYYNRSIQTQQPYLGLGQQGIAAINQYMFGTPAQAAQEARAASGTNPDEAARITADWNDIRGKYESGQQAINDAKAKLDQEAAKGYSSQTAGAISKAQQDYVNAQKSVEGINADYWSKKSKFEGIQPYIAAQEARAATEAIPSKLEDTFQTTKQKGWNARNAPIFKSYKAPPEFKKFEEPIPEYKKLTEQEMIENDPGYQFRLEQGEGALQNSALAKGGFFSGNTAQAMQDYAQNYASDEFSKANERNVQNYGIGLDKWKLGYDKNTGDFGNTLTGWKAGYEQNNQNFLNEENSWLNEYNAFVQNQNNQYDKIMGLTRVGQEAADVTSGLNQNAGANIAGTIGDKYKTMTNAQNAFADNLQGSLMGQDVGQREADAQRAGINANTIGAVGNNLGTGALLAYSQYKNSLGAGGTGSAGVGGSTTGNLNNSIANAFNNQAPSYKWS